MSHGNGGAGETLHGRRRSLSRFLHTDVRTDRQPVPATGQAPDDRFRHHDPRGVDRRAVSERAKTTIGRPSEHAGAAPDHAKSHRLRHLRDALCTYDSRTDFSASPEGAKELCTMNRHRLRGISEGVATSQPPSTTFHRLLRPREVQGRQRGPLRRACQPEARHAGGGGGDEPRHGGEAQGPGRRRAR